MTASLVRIGYGRADRARAASRLSGAPVLCRLVRRAVRRTTVHRLELGTVAPTCSLAVGSTSVLVSSIDYQVRAAYYSHSYLVRLPAECAMHCGVVYNSM